MAILITPRSWLRHAALAWLVLLLLLAALAPLLPLPFPPGVPDLAQIARPPFETHSHWLGTDAQGLDVLSQLLFGARTAVLLTLPAAVLAAVAGALAGSVAGFWGNSLRVAGPYWLVAAGAGWWALGLPRPLLVLALALGAAAALVGLARQLRRPVPARNLPIETLLMGLATTLDTIPRLVVVVAMAASSGLSMPGLLALLALTSWPHPARLVRAQMLRVRTLPFIDAARAAGIPLTHIWLRHALPHALQPLRSAFPLSVAGLLGLESTLSFLGIGLPPNVASLGRLLAGIRSEPSAWWVALFPIIFLTISILSLQALSRFRLSKDESRLSA